MWIGCPCRRLLLEIGFILMAVALWRYGRVLGELLQIIDKPPLEVLIRVAAVLIVLTFAIPHYIVSAVIYPNLLADQRMFQYLGLFRTFSFAGLPWPPSWCSSPPSSITGGPPANHCILQIADCRLLIWSGATLNP